MMSFDFHLVYIIPIEKTEFFVLLYILGYENIFFLKKTFCFIFCLLLRFFFLSLVLSNLIMCLGIVFSCFFFVCVFNIHWTSWLCRFMVSVKYGKTLVIILQTTAKKAYEIVGSHYFQFPQNHNHLHCCVNENYNDNKLATIILFYLNTEVLKGI